MGEGRKLEYFLLRYVPDAVRGESLNIGLVMTEIGGDGGGFAAVHFTKDWRRPKCLYPDIDIDLLEAIGRDIEARIANVQERAVLLHQMADLYSNAIQFSSVKRCFAEDPVREMEYLVASLVETPNSDGSPLEEPTPRKAGRRWIHSEMSREFRSAGVWNFLTKDVPASPYTNDKDGFTFDFAYAVGNEIKLFHAVSMVHLGQETKMFPLRVAKIGPRMADLREASPQFTAVVEDGYDAQDLGVITVLAFMKDEKIRVAGIHEMPGIADVARRELRA
jgi:hypothetical protein